MITSINAGNNELYEVLFAKAGEILSGYKSVQTYSKETTYYKKDPTSPDGWSSIDLTRGEEGLSETQLIENFSDELAKNNGKLFVRILDQDGNWVGITPGFVPSIGITSLEEYYNWLPLLKAETVLEDGESVEVPTVFTKLPLDEPHFEIKADTRAITVPPEFKKNGIAVQCDDLAEIVYFEIDRFFDAVDLNNTEIYIEWETPKPKTGGEPLKAVSKPYLKIIDDENKLGKLIFGWALCKDITQSAGTLKFAVRFIQRDINGKIVYSFNTLTAQATIHPGLNTDMDSAISQADDCRARLLERIQESEVVGGGKAEIPYFLTDLVVLDDGYDLYLDGEPYYREGGKYRLYAVATADDTGAVSCTWKKGTLNPDNIPTEKDEWNEIRDTSKFGVERVAVTEDELLALEKNGVIKLDTKRVYYIKTSDDANGFSLLEKKYYELTDPNVVKHFANYGVGYTNEKLKVPTIYEDRSYLDVEGYGQYQAVARNRIFNSLTKADSTPVMFKRPEPVVFEQVEGVYISDGHVIGKKNDTLTPVVKEAPGVMDYKWYMLGTTASIANNVSCDELPSGTKIVYGANTINILAPETSADYDFQDVDESLGGNPATYYIPVKMYGPSEATDGILTGCYRNDEDIKNKTVADNFFSDDKGYYFLEWMTMATYDAEAEKWVPNRGTTFRHEFDWFNADGVKLNSSAVVVNMVASEEDFYTLGKYQETEFDTVELQPSEPGYYKLHATRTRNADSVSNTSIIYRVTNPAEIPNATGPMFTAKNEISVEQLNREENPERLILTWDPVASADYYEVIWSLSKHLDEGKSDIDFPVMRYPADALKSEFNPASIENVAYLQQKGETNADAIYYARVRSVLNTDESDYSVKPSIDFMYRVFD